MQGFRLHAGRWHALVVVVEVVVVRVFGLLLLLVVHARAMCHG